MPTIGVRVSHTLFKKVEEAAKAHSTTKSDLIRGMIEDNLQINPTEDWEVIAWNLFSISSDQFKYAMRNSRTAEEFFSSVGKWSKNLDLKVFRTETQVGVSIRWANHVITSQQSRELSKIEAISTIIMELSQIMHQSYTDEELAKDFDVKPG
jgi:hypothetical protein